MKLAINVAAAALVLLACAPAFAHGGGMGHMGGNMGAGDGKVIQRTVIGDHHGDHHMHRRYTKTNIRLKTVKISKTVRIEQEIQRLKLKLVKLTVEGRGNSFEARRLLYRFTTLTKMINS
ncbi:MAG TPA: hypothetical protein VIJ04_18295 [Xanthobacteraceae bacterium]